VSFAIDGCVITLLLAKDISDKEFVGVIASYEEKKHENIKFNNIENDHIVQNKPFGLSDNRCIILEIQKEHEDFKNVVNLEEYCKDSSLTFIQSLNKEIKDRTFEVICSRNGGVVNYSPTASAVLRCNTAAYHLGGNEQAKGTLFYLIKYITDQKLKNKGGVCTIIFGPKGAGGKR
jgi:hypothetical protein